MPPERPDPEDLLSRIQKQEQQQKCGKLKIFLGASPGVGKTYAMLADARSQHASGLDVVIGVVETHGRKEVEACLPTFEILSPQSVHYRGKSLGEFDLDAALQRRPQLILIDEMAHTNAPGLRHAKRWQDIKEILDNGIDVYTTLNIQHVESLNDTIAQITGVHVRETVPDSLLDMANAIELIDLPLDDLLKRLQDGKIYVPTQAGLALQHFFRDGNLMALRELALRFTAMWVDRQVLSHRKEQKVIRTWPTTERLLVYIDASPDSLKVIRAARRMASTLRAEWLVVYAEASCSLRLEEQRAKVIHTLRLAEQLGAETFVLSGLDVTQELITLARARNVSKIVLGKQSRPRWQEFLHGSLVEELARRSDDIDIFYITRGDHKTMKPVKTVDSHRALSWQAYGIAAGVFSLASGVNALLYQRLESGNLILVYLLGVVLVAMQGSFGASIAVSILSVITYDFFFTPPLSIAASGAHYAFTLTFMFFVAYIISHLTIITRRQAESAHLRERRTAALYGLSRHLAESRGTEQILTITARYIAELFESNVLILLSDANHFVTRVGYPDTQELDSKEESIARWVFHTKQIAGMGTDTLSFADAIYVPLLAMQGPVGVLRVQPKQLLTPEHFHLLETCANQIALTLEADNLRGQTILKGKDGE